MVGGMDLCCRIETRIRRCRRPPASWIGEAFDDLVTVDDVVRVVRAIGPRSDRLLRALVEVAAADTGLVVEVVVAAAHPLLHRRCAANRALSVDDFTTELALVVASAMEDGLPTTPRHLLNVLIDMAWGQYRKPFRRRQLPVVEAERVGHQLVSAGRQPEDVLDGVALSAFRDRLAETPWSQRALVRCWNSAVELGTKDSRTQSERDRLKYARSQLRRLAPPELVA